MLHWVNCESRPIVLWILDFQGAAVLNWNSNWSWALYSHWRGLCFRGWPGSSADLLHSQDVARVESLDSPHESRGSAGFAKKPVKVDFEDRAHDWACVLGFKRDIRERTKTFPAVISCRKFHIISWFASCIVDLAKRTGPSQDDDISCKTYPRIAWHQVSDEKQHPLDSLSSWQRWTYHCMFSPHHCKRCMCCIRHRYFQHLEMTLCFSIKAQTNVPLSTPARSRALCIKKLPGSHGADFLVKHIDRSLSCIPLIRPNKLLTCEVRPLTLWLWKG